MTPPTDELSRMLRGTADEIVDRAHLPGPDTPELWRRGRRVTWVARAGGAGLVAIAVVLAAAVVLVMRPAPATVPAEGASLTYPEFVSELFPGTYRGGPVPVFGFVTAPQETTSRVYAIDRGGLLSAVRGTSPLSGGGVLAPDGLHLLVEDGIVDLAVGSLIRPMATDEVARGRTSSEGVWAPDSQHVLVDTANGPAVLDLFANVVVAPAAEDRTVLPAGWRDAATLLGVRVSSAEGEPSLEIVTRGIKENGWTPVSRVEVGEVEGQVFPGAAHASPDGSRILLNYPTSTASDAGWAALVDTDTGQRVAFTGADADDVPAWDGCPPVWQGNQPLTTSGGLRRPGDQATVLEFSGRMDLGCVTLAGNELTGTAEPNPPGVLREQVWRVVLPVGGALALIGAVWMALALRRSRRHGERFLPMIYVQRF